MSVAAPMPLDAAAARAAQPMLWVDGRRVDPATAQLSALDRGFTLGDGIFETMRAYSGAVFRLDRHLARLADGARVLAIALPSGLDRLVRDAMRAARDTGLCEASLRLTVSRGPGAPGIAPSPDAATTVALAIQPPPVFPPALAERGLSARIARARRNERAATAGVKTTAYAEAIVALAEARDAGADDALFLDTEGHLSEATASNLFLCVGGALLTPPCTCGALPGITRAAVMELAPALGLVVEERVLDASEVSQADEAFLTSSLREIAPLVLVDGQPIGTGAVGPITRRITEGYRAAVLRECGP